MNEILSPLITDVTKAIVAAFAGIATAFVLSSYKKVMAWINAKAEMEKNNAIQEALWTLQTIIKATVDSAEQTMVKKDINGKSTLSEEQSKKIRDYVINIVRLNAPNETMNTLAKYGVNIDSLIITFIEQSVLQAKQK